jgi:hypothetical protein
MSIRSVIIKGSRLRRACRLGGCYRPPVIVEIGRVRHDGLSDCEPRLVPVIPATRLPGPSPSTSSEYWRYYSNRSERDHDVVGVRCAGHPFPPLIAEEDELYLDRTVAAKLGDIVAVSRGGQLTFRVYGCEGLAMARGDPPAPSDEIVQIVGVVVGKRARFGTTGGRCGCPRRSP